MLGIALIVLPLLSPNFCGGQAFAQDEASTPRDMESNERAPGQNDGDLITRLNLTQDQVRQIREIRMNNAEEMRNTRQRMIRAQNALDEAIYADSVDESAIEAHASDLAAAQAAVARLRALTELRIRRLLTPEQLNLLRSFRQQARERGRQDQRRRQDSSAFQERQRPNGFRPNPNGTRQPTNPPNAKPGTTDKMPSNTTPSNNRP